jgi:hypothetical protein
VQAFVSQETLAQLQQLAEQTGAAVLRGAGLPPEDCERRRRTALKLNLRRYIKTGYHGPWGTEAELALLDTMPDAKVAARIGRSAAAVRSKRGRVRQRG